MHYVQADLHSKDDKVIDLILQVGDTVQIFQINLLLEEECKEESLLHLLKGKGASPGQVEGPVKVISDPEDFQGFDKGKILVSRTACRELIQILPEVSGLVTERGGILANALGWARQLGVPAVVGVGNLLARVKDGDRIRINGWEGTVEVISE